MVRRDGGVRTSGHMGQEMRGDGRGDEAEGRGDVVEDRTDVVEDCGDMG